MTRPEESQAQETAKVLQVSQTPAQTAKGLEGKEEATEGPARKENLARGALGPVGTMGPRGPLLTTTIGLLKGRALASLEVGTPMGPLTCVATAESSRRVSHARCRLPTRTTTAG